MILKFTMGMLLFGFYIVFPYWKFLKTDLGQGIFFIFIIISAIIWAICVKRPDFGKIEKKVFLSIDGLVISILFLFTLAIHSGFLNLSFAWRGDEEFHVLRTTVVNNYYGQLLSQNITMLLILLCAGGIIAIILSKVVGRIAYFSTLLFITLLFFSIAFRGADTESLKYWLIRYPPFIIIPELLCANEFLGTLFIESAHRMPAFLSFFFAAILIYSIFRKEGFRTLDSIIPSIIILSFPLSYYYSTVIYIEPILLCWECIIIYLLMSNGFPDKETQNYTLAVVAAFGGVIKETTIPFLGAVFLALLVRAIQSENKGVLKKITDVMRFGIIIFLPAVPYFYLRILSGERTYQMLFGNLFQRATYQNYAHSLIYFITISLTLISLAGLIFLFFYKRHRETAFLTTLSIFFYFLLLSTDSTAYIGYSRFMLHFFPLVFTGVFGFFMLLKQLLTKYLNSSRMVHYAVGIIIIAVNLWLAPRTLESRSVWFEPTGETAEDFYPYKEAVSYIAEHYSDDYTIVLFGIPYNYRFFPIYQARYNSNHSFASVKETRLDLLISYCKKKNIRKCLFLHHVLEEPAGDPKILNKFLVKHFDLGPHRLDLYEVVFK